MEQDLPNGLNQNNLTGENLAQEEEALESPIHDQIRPLEEVYGTKFLRHISRFNGQVDPLEVATNFVVQRYIATAEYPGKQEVFNAVSIGYGNNTHGSGKRVGGVKGGHSHHRHGRV